MPQMKTNSIITMTVTRTATTTQLPRASCSHRAAPCAVFASTASFSAHDDAWGTCCSADAYGDHRKMRSKRRPVKRPVNGKPGSPHRALGLRNSFSQGQTQDNMYKHTCCWKWRKRLEIKEIKSEFSQIPPTAVGKSEVMLIVNLKLFWLITSFWGSDFSPR